MLVRQQQGKRVIRITHIYLLLVKQERTMGQRGILERWLGHVNFPGVILEVENIRKSNSWDVRTF